MDPKDYQRLRERYLGKAAVSEPGAGASAGALERAEAVIASDRKFSHKLGYRLTPYIRGAMGWLAAAAVYYVGTGQSAMFGAWHNFAKPAWDNLINAPWWTMVRHLFRGLGEGALFGIYSRRSKNPVKKRHRAEYREKVLTGEAKIEEPGIAKKAGLAVTNAFLGAVGIVAVVAVGKALVYGADLPAVAQHLHGVDHDLQQFGQFVSSHTKRVPTPVRTAFDLSDPTEDIGRVAGITSHWAARSATKNARLARHEEMVQKAIEGLTDGSVTASRPWRGAKGTAIREAAERIVTGTAYAPAREVAA